MTYHVLDQNKNVIVTSDKKEYCVLKASEYFTESLYNKTFYVVNENGDVVMDFVSIK